MILEYDENGLIYHIVDDPVSPALKVHYEGKPGVKIVEPTRGPPQPRLNADGEQEYDEVQQNVYDNEGDPVLDENGEQVTETISVPVFDEGDLISAKIRSDSHYVLNGEVVERPIFTIPESHVLAVGAELQINGLPDPCKIKLDGEEIDVEGGILTIGADMPAEYLLELVQWPYVPASMKVIVNAA
jgi:hypothetical protein